MATSREFGDSNDEKNSIRKILEEIEKKSGGNKISESVIRDSLNNWKDAPVNFGVVGETNSGKSSFINAIRGMKDDDTGAAKVGLFECTRRRKGYELPQNKSIIFWDLPGVGTSVFKKEDYFNFIEVEKYDFLLIVSCTRFSETDKWLAIELKKLNKVVYFIRTKIDVDVANDQKDKPDTHNPADVIQTIKDDVQKRLLDMDIDYPVFLVSNRHRNEYEMKNLLAQICSNSHGLKKEAITLSFSNVYSESFLDDKKKALKNRIYKAALLSAIAGANPIPGTGLVADIAVITEEIMFCRSQLGLTEERIKEAAKLSDNSEKDFLKDFAGVSVGLVTVRMIAIASATTAAAFAIRATSKAVLPMIGGLVMSPVSFATTSSFLKTALDDMHKDAVKLHRIVASQPVNARQKQSFNLQNEVKVAIIGRSGSGKSSLINAFRGIGSNHKEAAETGVTETTTESAEYKYKDYEGVKLVDTPGIGTSNVTKGNFLKHVKLKKCSIVVVCVGTAIGDDDEWLLLTAKKFNKPVVFVRTNVNRCPDEYVNDIKKNCEGKLDQLTLKDVKVFFIDNKEPEKYDFKALKDNILDTCFEESCAETKKCILQ